MHCLEFVEFFNSNPWPHDLSGYQLDGDVEFTFPPNTMIPGGGFLVLAAVPADLQFVAGVSGVLGPYTGSLKSSGALVLYDEAGALLLEVNYADTSPWPMGGRELRH